MIVGDIGRGESRSNVATSVDNVDKKTGEGEG